MLKCAVTVNTFGGGILQVPKRAYYGDNGKNAKMRRCCEKWGQEMLKCACSELG